MLSYIFFEPIQHILPKQSIYGHSQIMVGGKVNRSDNVTASFFKNFSSAQK
jgi:hypothetical protein